MNRWNIFILVFIIHFQAEACSIFYATDGNKILTGKNTDWKVPMSLLKFYPATAENHGYMVHCIQYLGNYFSINGGMNDQGLIIEWADNLLPRDWSYNIPDKIIYPGDIEVKILTSCSNVGEVIDFFKTYFNPGFSASHLLVGDRFGNSVVVERGDNNTLALINGTGNYQVVTNFLNSYITDPKTADFVGCYRYTYINQMLKDNKDLSVDLFRTILDGAANKSAVTPTIYSIIYDVKNLDIYAYAYSNYKEVLKYNLAEELNKGNRYFLLPELFSGLKGIFPVSNEKITASSVNISWYGNADQYEILLATNKDFSEAQKINADTKNYQEATFQVSVFMLLFVLLIQVRKNRKLLTAGVFVILITGSCKKDLVILPDTISHEVHSIIADKLLPGKNYYWKIIATKKTGFTTESEVYSFTTVKSFDN